MNGFPTESDVIIIGAGVTGVAVSRALALKNPTWKITLLEKEDSPGCHASGRNSGVVHSGFNPEPGSLKARLNVAGNRRLQEYCRLRGVPLKAVDTAVVASSKLDVKSLEELYRRGRENGVPDLRILDQPQLKKLEPRVRGLAALHTRASAVVDSRRFVEALAEEASEKGVNVVLGQRVDGIEKNASKWIVRVGEKQFRSTYLVNSAGLYADHLAHMVNVGLEYMILPFRGEYYRVRKQKAEVVKTLVYRAPDLNYPFLGIHLTPTVYGELRAGPNAVVAPGREAYSNKEMSIQETLAMLFDARSWRLVRKSEFRRLACRHLRTSLSKRAFLAEVLILVAGLDHEDLVEGPPSGIRAQVVDQAGHLIDDMLVKKEDEAIHVLNVVSPGLTCAMAFADYLASLWQ